ncbi:hypothetical protein PAXRUDRAFT_831951 [Paxillus rubicundulus Ve08.2h10]|uniref:Uncharacterized protein n=1 Tax=Paxillus rubicundulus Ve08.2h10 TaxID=930991 RepID=A0A0D0DJ76_9AGAM|nr:hypothetical protein PAXRUDRAFT_831951 [Paxillus rubicundulus Ve08.2h10]
MAEADHPLTISHTVRHARSPKFPNVLGPRGYHNCERHTTFVGTFDVVRGPRTTKSVLENSQRT